MNREEKLAKNTLILAIGTFLPKVASFITLPVLTGFLTQKEYGIYDLITVMVSLVLPAATLQIQTAAFRYLIDARQDYCKQKYIITNIFVFTIPISIISLVVLYFCLFNFTVDIKILICLYFFADNLVGTCRQIVRGLSNNFVFSISAIISSLGKMIFAVICVWYFRMGICGAVIALLASDILSLVYLWIKTKLYRYIGVSYIKYQEIIEMLKYSWPMVPNSMSMWVMRVSDRLVVTVFMGVTANAIYAVANKLPSLLNIAQNTFTMAWQENASIYSNDDDVDVYYSEMFNIVYDLTAGLLGLLIAGTPILFSLLIRGNYSEAYYQIPILFLGNFFYTMATYLGGIYVAQKETRSVGVTTIIAAMCNLIINLLLIRFIGLFAASGSTFISYFILFLFRMIDVRKISKLKYKYIHLVIVFLIMIIECLLCIRKSIICNIVNIILSILVFLYLNRDILKSIATKIIRR